MQLENVTPGLEKGFPGQLAEASYAFQGKGGGRAEPWPQARVDFWRYHQTSAVTGDKTGIQLVGRRHRRSDALETQFGS